ncbi:MAG TPA: hypothetical protein VGR73_20510 [Bryobacteraceae bacterium]|nr:hypothetical protein [Bryobacteraceae bacterium]
MQDATNICVRIGADDLARLQQLVPTLRRKTGANCNLSSVIRQMISICLKNHQDELVADLKEAA